MQKQITQYYDWPAAILIPQAALDELVLEGAVKYPNAKLRINPAASLTFDDGYTAKEIGLIWRRIRYAALAGDFDFAMSFPFILKVFKGVHPGRVRKRIPAPIRRAVLAIGLCNDCKSTVNLSIDHIRPVTKGGTDDRRNLQCLCLPCNISKGNFWRGRR